jgi:hypothetical protein
MRRTPAESKDVEVIHGAPRAAARLIGGLLALVPCGLPAQNLIRNPSFEEVGPTGAIAAWSVSPS